MDREDGPGGWTGRQIQLHRVANEQRRHLKLSQFRYIVLYRVGGYAI